MLVRVDAVAATASLAEAEDLGRLTVEVAGEADGSGLDRALGALGRPDGDHVWLDVAALRAAAGPRDPDWQRRFDAMVDYARSRGWTDQAATRLRAHVVQVGEAR